MGFLRALELLEGELNKPRLSTGVASLDELLGGGIRSGVFYLFYGSEDCLEPLLYRILVNSLLPVGMGGFGGKTVYLYCGSYRIEKNVLDTSLLTSLVKALGLDPEEALDRVEVFLAFSGEQQMQVVDNVAKIITDKREVKLLLVHSIAGLFKAEGRLDLEKMARLKYVVSRLWQNCAERGVAMVASCGPRFSRRGELPRPEGGRYLQHLPAVVVYVRRVGGRAPACETALVKHPSRPLRSVKFTLGEVLGVGRVTSPFRAALQKEVENLRRHYRDVLTDKTRRKAFDSLVSAWASEAGAMSNSNVPALMDNMLLTAAVDNRRLLEELTAKVEQLQAEVEKLRQRLGKSGSP